MPAKNMILLRLSDSLIPVCFIVKGKIQRLFDLGADPVVIAQTLGPLAADLPGLRVPGAFDGFEMAVRAVLGQLVSVAGTRTFAGRLAERFGTPLPTPNSRLNKIFPTAGCLAKLSIESIQAIGLTRKRAETISALARAVHEGDLILEPGHRLHGTLKLLRSLPGIGEWTAQYIAMRVLAWPDAFPHLDLGIRKAMGNASPKQILEAAEKWRPWRAYAALHLWNQLSNKTKTHTL
jgi:AraC family transcriptional regulator of adaptative response / DNA-3-methyladenine glycosylase II